MKRLHVLAGATLCRLQGIPLYRRIGQRIAPGMTLREATDADKLVVHRWFNPNGDPTQVFQRNPYVTEWVAEYRSRLAGFVQLVRHPPEHFPYTGNWLFALHVKSICRGLGIGQALSEAVIERSRAEGAPTLDLLVYEDNIRAIDLYRKLAFEMYTNPDLEAQLESERASFGRRRVAMRKRLTDHDLSGIA
ncbi:GNAT family N-acetyltransferase [Candidatus Deferrimicrobium sp.]|uniref:GNAT family N-acetyltransferase n=1 Tax=Candidatus Deferrimicrobium sp. TaxID=3060586 RepID=UPI00271BB3E5|nr:N-acetyltransferase [Candidatus Deferrimicrobium sp.]MCR4256753.1 GNAT family N-acetyltransferase [Candidatus Uhrbacteria bacterium]MDO8738181.1 N-acetyltransferase [Candidatus Deferrimicrobium sp.]